jgi:hypothetical protein
VAKSRNRIAKPGFSGSVYAERGSAFGHLSPISIGKEGTMPQKRKSEHIEGGYESRGVSEKEAERRAWATVNKSGSGHR